VSTIFKMQSPALANRIPAILECWWFSLEISYFHLLVYQLLSSQIPLTHDIRYENPAYTSLQEAILVSISVTGLGNPTRG
jgi:hypothetical protein